MHSAHSSKKLLAIEWVALLYLAFTILLIFFTYTKHPDPLTLIGARMQVLAMMGGLWIVHWLFPCQATLFLRVLLQAALLSWWYPDTYDLNRVLPNLDPSFAALDQSIFGCQPALELAKVLPGWMSEAFYLGYWSYYPMIVGILVYYLLFQRNEFLKAGFILLASFFAFYVIFDLVPVAGPTFYYKFAGIESIAAGTFPDVGNYFMNSQDCLPPPGNTDGLFYGLVEAAKEAGERPTAAFPSSHVGCSTVIMLLAFNSKRRWLTWVLAPFFILLCIATVYIQAHYAIDAIVGLPVGASFYFIFKFIFEKS